MWILAGIYFMDFDPLMPVARVSFTFLSCTSALGCYLLFLVFFFWYLFHLHLVIFQWTSSFHSWEYCPNFQAQWLIVVGLYTSNELMHSSDVSQLQEAEFDPNDTKSPHCMYFAAFQVQDIHFTLIWLLPKLPRQQWLSWQWLQCSKIQWAPHETETRPNLHRCDSQWFQVCLMS